MICCNPLKTSELWHHEIFGHEIHGFLSTFEKAMKCHFHGYFKASRSLYSIFHGSWIWKFSQVFHGIFQVFFMALRPWKCHWLNHENPVKNLWIYNELFRKIFMGFEFIVVACYQYIGWGPLAADAGCHCQWVLISTQGASVPPTMDGQVLKEYWYSKSQGVDTDVFKKQTSKL